jgi:hypothetical protein
LPSQVVAVGFGRLHRDLHVMGDTLKSSKASSRV